MAGAVWRFKKVSRCQNGVLHRTNISMIVYSATRDCLFWDNSSFWGCSRSHISPKMGHSPMSLPFVSLQFWEHIPIAQKSSPCIHPMCSKLSFCHLIGNTRKWSGTGSKCKETWARYRNFQVTLSRKPIISQCRLTCLHVLHMFTSFPKSGAQQHAVVCDHVWLLSISEGTPWDDNIKSFW